MRLLMEWLEVLGGARTARRPGWLGAVGWGVWWTILFAVLPFGVRTQAEDDEVVLGTVASAPVKFRAWRVVLITTVASAIIYGTWFVSATYLGYGFDAIPVIVPRYGG